MKVKDLLELLQGADKDASVAIQKNQGDGHYSLHTPIFWLDGHIGFKGVLIQMGGGVEDQVGEPKQESGDD